MATLSAPVNTQKNDKRRISNETLCSSNSSCVLQKRKQLHPLATNVKYKNNSNNTVKQRVLSAKYLRFKTLQNELNDANFHIAQLINENKLLKNLQKRQDHALAKYEGTNAEIPKMIESHQEEIRVLQVKIKNLRKNIRELNEQIKAKDDEVNNLKDQNKHLLNLCRNKNLDERDKLSKKVEELEDMLRQRDNTISTLNRKVALETKNCKFKLAAEVSKNKALQRELLKTQQQIEDLQIIAEGKEIITERRSSRNKSSDRKKLFPKFNTTQEKDSKPNSSGKKTSGNNSTSSLILSEESDLHDVDNLRNNPNEKINANKSNDKEINNTTNLHPDTYSSELQLKNIVNNWQKKNIPDSLNECYVDMIESAETYTKVVEGYTSDFKHSENELENLLSTLKETDEINNSFRRVSISSPVLDFTNLFKNKDKNSNIIKINPITIDNETPNSDESNLSKKEEKINEKNISNPEINNILNGHKKLEPESTDNILDYDETITPRRQHKINSESEDNAHDDFKITKNYYEMNFKDNESNLLESNNEKINIKFNSENIFESNKLEVMKSNSNMNLGSSASSTSDLDEDKVSQRRRRSNKSEVANEDKMKLLAKLKAIDNGESIEFTGVNKTKDDFINELFR